MEHRLFPISTVLALAAFTLAALTVLVAGDLTSVDSQQRVLRTQAIEIVDGTGAVRLTLDAFGGRPTVWLFDAHRQRRLGLTVSAQGAPEVSLVDEEGTPRLLLRVGTERAAELRLTDPRGRPRIGLWVDYHDDPGLWMFDALARPRIGMKVLGGDPRIWLFEHTSGRLTFTAP